MTDQNDFFDYSPNVGLEYVVAFDITEPDYSFDLFQVMYNPETNAYHIGQDSGCSCPSPFEDFTTLEDWGQPYADPRQVARLIRATTVSTGLLDGKLRAAEYVLDHARTKGILK